MDYSYNLMKSREADKKLPSKGREYQSDRYRMPAHESAALTPTYWLQNKSGVRHESSKKELAVQARREYPMKNRVEERPTRRREVMVNPGWSME